MKQVLLSLFALSVFAAPWTAEAEEEQPSIFDKIRLSGFVASELRYYPEPSAFDGQMNGAEASLVFQPELRWRSDDRDTRATLIPFARLASRDAERSHFDLREAHISHRFDDWDILVGVNKVFWGVTESRHLVDIVNQSDFAEDIDGEDKLGQPMVNVGTQQDWGRIDAYILPGFRDRTHVGLRGRNRPAQTIDDSRAQYESGAGQAHVSYAARYSHFIGDWDVGLSVFHGLARDPRLVLEDGRRVPYYDKITQAGLDLQYTQEAWLWKLEAIGVEGHGDPFAAAVGGFEYTYYQIIETDADLGLLLEYHRDGRSNDNAPGTNFDDDIFVGMRLTLNDVQDTEALIGATIDKDDGSTFMFAEAERRIGDNWVAEFEARLFVNADGGDLGLQADDSFLNMRLARYF